MEQHTMPQSEATCGACVSRDLCRQRISCCEETGVTKLLEHLWGETNTVELSLFSSGVVGLALDNDYIALWHQDGQGYVPQQGHICPNMKKKNV